MPEVNFYRYSLNNSTGSLIRHEVQVRKDINRKIKRINGTAGSTSTVDDTLRIIDQVVSGSADLLAYDFNAMPFLLNKVMYSLYRNKLLLRQYEYLIEGGISRFESFGYITFEYQPSNLPPGYHNIFLKNLDNIINIELPKIVSFLNLVKEVELYLNGGQRPTIPVYNTQIIQTLSTKHEEALSTRYKKDKVKLYRVIQSTILEPNNLKWQFDTLDKLNSIVLENINLKKISQHVDLAIQLISSSKSDDIARTAIAFQLALIGENINKTKTVFANRSDVPIDDYISCRDCIVHTVDRHERTGQSGFAFHTVRWELLQGIINSSQILDYQRLTKELRFLKQVILEIVEPREKDLPSFYWDTWHKAVSVVTPTATVYEKLTKEETKAIKNNVVYKIVFDSSDWSTIRTGQKFITSDYYCQLENWVNNPSNSVNERQALEKIMRNVHLKLAVQCVKWSKNLPVKQHELMWLIEQVLLYKLDALGAWVSYFNRESIITEACVKELMDVTQDSARLQSIIAGVELSEITKLRMNFSLAHSNIRPIGTTAAIQHCKQFIQKVGQLFHELNDENCLDDLSGAMLDSIINNQDEKSQKFNPTVMLQTTLQAYHKRIVGKLNGNAEMRCAIAFYLQNIVNILLDCVELHVEDRQEILSGQIEQIHLTRNYLAHDDNYPLMMSAESPEILVANLLTCLSSLEKEVDTLEVSLQLQKKLAMEKSRQASEYYKKKDYKNAEPLFLESLQAYRLTGGDAQLMYSYNYGMCLHKLGRTVEATPWFREIIESKTANPNLAPQLTENLMQGIQNILADSKQHQANAGISRESKGASSLASTATTMSTATSAMPPVGSSVMSPTPGASSLPTSIGLPTLRSLQVSVPMSLTSTSTTTSVESSVVSFTPNVTRPVVSHSQAGKIQSVAKTGTGRTR